MRLMRWSMAPRMAPAAPARLHETDRFLAGSTPTIAAVHDQGEAGDEVITRELGFAVGLLRRTAFRRELQRVCVELGLGCDIDARTRLLTTRAGPRPRHARGRRRPRRVRAGVGLVDLGRRWAGG